MNSEPEKPDNPRSLPEAIARHGIEIPGDQAEMLVRYCTLLWDINLHLNLTRHTTCEKFVARDLVDTIQLAKLLEPKERVLDVGTGGGVPGIPLAILRPDLKVSLVESVAKRALAVQQIVADMPLRLRVYHRRAEELLDDQSFDTLVIRAVAPLPKLLTWFSSRWKAIGRLLIVKGPSWVDERAEARHRGQLKKLNLRKLATYPLPGTDKESVILEVKEKERK